MISINCHTATSRQLPQEFLSRKFPAPSPTSAADFLQDVLQGLNKKPKQIPCKYFYDERGSRLFTEICQTPEYYITRTELRLLNAILPEIADLLGSNVNIIEYGSGEGRKVRDLLSALQQPKSYTPIDISAEMLFRSAQQLAEEFPRLAIYPLIGDYTTEIELPKAVAGDRQHRRLVFFPGSTISNFTPEEAQQFLLSINKLLAPQDVLLLGADLLKSPQMLHQAYNDSTGVTASFNLNLLRRINSELGADFDLQKFEHYAFFNLQEARIEMHLISKCEQQVTVAGHTFHFAQGESIHTENSYKYTMENIAELARVADFSQDHAWTDAKEFFSIHYLTKR